MRSLRLARIAAQAELLRLRRFAARQAGRAVIGAVALVFALAFLACLHVAGFFALRRADIMAVWAALIVAGVDALIALILALLALRNQPGALEREALAVRLSAEHQMMETVAVSAAAAAVTRALGVRRAYGLAVLALLARYLGMRR